MSDYGIKTYADLAETCGGMVLANEMAYRPMELMSGNWAPWEEIFQWYIVQDPSFLMKHTDEPVFYDGELCLYVWGLKTFARAGPSCPPPRFTSHSCPMGAARNRRTLFFSLSCSLKGPCETSSPQGICQRKTALTLGS